MGNLYRAQILLEPEQHRALAEIARSDNQSISAIVRESVRQYLARRARDVQSRREMQAFGALTQTRRKIQERHGVYQGDPLAEIRAEREQDMERVWRGEE